MLQLCNEVHGSIKTELCSDIQKNIMFIFSLIHNNIQFTLMLEIKNKFTSTCYAFLEKHI